MSSWEVETRELVREIDERIEAGDADDAEVAVISARVADLRMRHDHDLDARRDMVRRHRSGQLGVDRGLAGLEQRPSEGVRSRTLYTLDRNVGAGLMDESAAETIEKLIEVGAPPWTACIGLWRLCVIR